jgi:hypothetical protein
MEQFISQKVTELKIKPKNIEIIKSAQNGWYVKVKYDRKNKECRLNKAIIKEQYRRILDSAIEEAGIDRRSCNKNERDSIIDTLLYLGKKLKRFNIRHRLEIINSKPNIK